MNLLKVKGYLVLFLKEIPICDLETLKKDPELDFKSEYAFYLSHIKTSFYDLNDSYMLSEELVGNISRAWLQRFKRLQIVSSRIYYASLHYTSDKIPNIVNTCKEEEYHRIIIFQSNDVVAHYAEFIEIFHLNSFLYQRYTKPRTLEAKYSSGGFINKKKL
ncbi:MAG: hypothetical protein KDK45_22295, partial [Leptospiraceae bacterium]|nr:hypothetical protein [Leptospiraceae bacterium]